MFNRISINNISFGAYRKESPMETPAERLIRDDKTLPTYKEMYEELDRLKEEIEKADKKLVRMRKSDKSGDEMKLMNEIKSEQEGKVVKICVKNGDPVEFGQVLMYVE